MRFQGIKDEKLSVVSLSNRTSKKCYSKKAEIGLKIGIKKVIICEKEHINSKNSKDRKPTIEKIVLRDKLEIPRGRWELVKIKELKRGRDGE
ncbi:unnamed protein product [Onchocerca flexuosa]|uniref:DUF5641 domain-containing protein n=1 Tax=Onchocerca flexuosa TaxID=387005 RepID=A0A183H0V7_9BILA|nr:unnamed protein product [Onchocerca flexuosa]